MDQPERLADLITSYRELLPLVAPPRAFIYILQFTDGKFYIGSTKNILTRLGIHLADSPTARLYDLVEVALKNRTEMERKMISLAAAHGWPIINRQPAMRRPPLPELTESSKFHAIKAVSEEQLPEQPRLQDVFKFPTAARLLDLLLANPGRYYSQGILKHTLNVDSATMRRAVARLERLGFVAVDVNPAGFGIKVIRLNETEQGKVFLDLYRRITALRLESKRDEP